MSIESEWDRVTADLTPARKARLAELLKQGTCLCEVFRAHRNGVKVNLASVVVKLRAVNDEIDLLVPPDQSELTAREVAKVVAEGMRILEMTKGLLEDITAEPRYRRLAMHVAQWATKRLSTYLPPPKVKFFFPDGERRGAFKPLDPMAIHIATELDDYDLVECVCHEVSHYASHPYDPTEQTAERAAWRLQQKYCAEYGRKVPGGWRAGV